MSENFSFDATMLDDEDEMSREPEMSVKSSKLLYIDDMEPSNLTQLEYSYQPDELITNFYFGPSHWKFLSKRTGNIKTRSRKKTTPQVTLEEILAFKRKDSSLILKSGRFNSLKKVCSSPKEQLLLPEDFQQTLNSLKGFNYSVLTFNDPINYGLPETSDFEMTFDDVDMNMTEADFQCLKETSSPNTNSSMKTPMTHEPISLNVLAHRSRNFNMKKLKSLALAVIDSEIQENNYVTFRLVHTKVHKMLCESCETPSCALSFLSILISASEVKLKIMKQNDDLNDFSIELF